MMQFFKYFFSVLFFCMAIISCGDDDTTNPEIPSGTSASPVANISYSVVQAYPHDTAAFTQGLVMYKGQLYEGTGGSDSSPEGKNSYLMRVNLQTGKPEKELRLGGQYFGEGITILNDTVYQLTWTSKVVFAYTLPDFKKVKEFAINTEGWGITHNGKELIVSDGSSNLYFYDPATFQLLRSQSVTAGGELLGNLNELEYIEGLIYANQWGSPYIFKIDPNDGQVKGRIDLSQVVAKLGFVNDGNKVLNGIAYDADTKKIYITGKMWPELYEIQLGQ